MSNFGIAFTTTRQPLAVLLLGSLCLALIACESHKAPPQSGRFQLHGVVVSIVKSEGSVVVKHDEIPGFMSAMTMPYEVADEKDLDKLSSGSEIRADVVVSRGAVRLENIKVIQKR